MNQVILRYCILLGCIIFTSTHCSSLKKSAFQIILKRSKDQQASQVKFWPPPPPYQQQKHPQLDVLWWNQKTSSSLSYFSNCSKQITTLKDIERGTLSEIESYKLIKTRITKNYIYSVIKIHHPDGEQTMSGMHTLKKGNCFYILNLISNSEKSFKKELPIFQKFIAGFQPK